MVEESENGNGPLENRRSMKTLKKHSRRSVILFLVGAALMVAIGIIEDDPTIPPVVMMAVGIGWFIVTRVRIRSHLKESH